MVFSSSCFCNSLISHKMNRVASTFTSNISIRRKQAIARREGSGNSAWGFLGGSRKRSSMSASCNIFLHSEIATSVFPAATIAVLPFYAFMVVAPKATLTQKVMESSIPYIVLGLLYSYLLYLSWTPDTMHLLFPNKYWLPELAGITKMFSREMTLASAWIHLLVVDLFAARQVYRDGLHNGIETRHSVSLCLLSCPIGLVTHFITKALFSSKKKT